MIVTLILEGGAAGIAYLSTVCGGAYGVGCPYLNLNFLIFFVETLFEALPLGKVQ